MGDIIRYTHKECGFKYDYYNGVGFSLFKLQCKAREKMRSGEWGKQWQDLLKENPEGTATINKALCFCPNCRKYFSEPQIRFYVPDDNYHYAFGKNHDDIVPTYVIFEHYHLLEKENMVCPDCATNATVMQKPNQIPCPICGKMRRGREIGNWD